MSYTPMQPASAMQQEFTEGLRKLKTAALIYIISALLVGLGFTAAMMSGLGGIKGLVFGGVGLLVAAIVGAILGLIALFGFLIPAFSHLRNADPSAFGTPATLVKIGYAVGFILIIIALVLIVSVTVTGNPGMVIGGMGLFFLGAIFLLIGLIGVAIGMFKLKDKTDESLFLVAGILFIIGIFIGILTFIAWILVFVGANSALNKLSSMSPQTQGYTVPPPPPR